MNALLQTILATGGISFISFVVILILAKSDTFLKKSVGYLVALSAGTMLGATFFHLMPEGIEAVDTRFFLMLVLFSFLLFFILEKFIYWRHCHDMECDVHTFGYINLIGDGIHNFMDGLIIASAFFVDPYLGVITTIAILFHEVPQEIGDFGVLIYAGFQKTKALTFNLLVSLTSVLGGVIGVFLINDNSTIEQYLLPLAAGSFLYISMTDLIPEIKNETNTHKSVFSFAYFFAGILLMFFALYVE